MQAVQHVKSNPLESDVLSLAMPILVCPACDAGLELKDSGVLCRDCGQTYSRNSSNGVIYFVEEESYAESFGLQWKTFSREQLDDDRLHDSLAKDALNGRQVEHKPSYGAQLAAGARLGGPHHRYNGRAAA